METDAEANARSEGSGSTPLIQLQSKELEEILNVIDQLRSEGVSKYINLPQLIVCGDQSSGKSSVLEALSGLAFPTRDNICTRFATELILRRLPESGVKASIHPDDDRPKTEKERIRKFKSPTVALDQFAKLVEGAEEFLGVGREGHPFSKDVLRVEVKGPTQPDLTLVDLPGLYHAPDESQDEEGVEFVESLVQSYISNKRSVILAVISAKSDIALQKVTAFTRKFDPNGSRTMGIITKPDTLPAGSDMEGSFYQLAMNKRVSLRLGWHVLKNRKYEERHFSLEQRRESESQFLATGVWRRVPRARVGIDSLRPRLSTILTDHIISQLPGLISEAQQEVKEANAGLQKLGTARGTISDQRRYLLHGSEKFTALLRNAIDGIYFDSYFGNAITDEGYERRLRAVIQNRLADFSNTMWRRGEQIEIIDDTEPSDVEDGNDGLLAERKIKRSKFVDEVQQRMRRSRGRELPGTYNPLIIGELFYLQSAPWEAIVNQQCEILLEDVQKAIVPILREVLDEKSVAQLLRHVIEPSLRKLEESLRSTTENLLKPQKAGHPITYNHYFTECIQKARERHFQKSLTEKLENFFGENYPSTPSSKYSFAFRMDALIEALGTQTETDMERFACSEAIDCMTAYYTVFSIQGQILYLKFHADAF